MSKVESSGGGITINDLEVFLRIFVVFEYHNSPLQLFEREEHILDTCSRGSVLCFLVQNNVNPIE